MKELKERFYKIKESNPEYGDVITMWYASNGRDYTRETIRKVFNLCVSKDEYDQSDKSDIVDHIYSYTKQGAIQK